MKNIIFYGYIVTLLFTLSWIYLICHSKIHLKIKHFEKLKCTGLFMVWKKLQLHNKIYSYNFSRHTIAYVASSGRLYAWGSGANGQLAGKDAGVRDNPVHVQGSFVPYSNVGVPMDMDNGPVFVINRVAAGGNQCFLWAVTPDVRNTTRCCYQHNYWMWL